jgi:general stress protein CsbA
LGEGAALFFYLVFVYAWHHEKRGHMRALLFALAEFGFICRQTVVLLMAPHLAAVGLQAFVAKDPALAAKAKGVLWLALFPALYFCWLWVTIGILFPQGPLQQEVFWFHTARIGGGYTADIFSWPGHSLLYGFFDPQVSALKKLMNVAHLLIVVVAGWALVGGVCRCRSIYQEYLLPFLAALVVNMLFILTIGGPFGHTQFFRYVATQINPVIIFALFNRHVLRLPWLIILGVLSVLAASLAGGVGAF